MAEASAAKTLYAGELQRSRNAQSPATERAAAKTGEDTEEINVVKWGLFALFMAGFDLVRFLLDFLFIVGTVLNWLIVIPFGWLTVWFWLKIHGYSISEARGNKKPCMGRFLTGFFLTIIPYDPLPGMSGFVVTFLMREKAAQTAKKISGGLIKV